MISEDCVWENRGQITYHVGYSGVSWQGDHGSQVRLRGLPQHGTHRAWRSSDLVWPWGAVSLPHSSPGVSDRPVFSPGPTGLPLTLQMARVSVTAPDPQALWAFRVAYQRAGCSGSVCSLSCCLFLSLFFIGLLVSSFVSVCFSLFLSVHRSLLFLFVPHYLSFLSLPLSLSRSLCLSPCMSLSLQTSHCLFPSCYL